MNFFLLLFYNECIAIKFLQASMGHKFSDYLRLKTRNVYGPDATFVLHLEYNTTSECFLCKPTHTSSLAFLFRSCSCPFYHLQYCYFNYRSEAKWKYFAANVAALKLEAKYME